MKENEETQNVGEESKAVLSGPCKVNEYDITSYEIEIPEIVLTKLDIDPKKDKLQFIKENGRVYIEKA